MGGLGGAMGRADVIWRELCPTPCFQRMGAAWLWLLGAGVLASAQGDESPGPPHAPSSAPAHRRVTPAITSFALRVYKQLAAEGPGSILFSPVSVASALALLSLGAHADTSAQILQGLGFNLTETPRASVHRGFQSLLRALGLPSPKLELRVGHALFLGARLTPRQRFLEAARELYGASAFPATLAASAAARRQLEDYVRKQTYGQVEGCLQALSDGTPMVLLSHLFFKAKWKQPFHRYQTQKQERALASGRPAGGEPMMHRKEVHRFLYDQERACTVLQVELSGNALALLVLPDPGRMQQVEAALQPETLRTWSQRLQPSLLDLHLPRFAISGAYSLEELLPRIGLGNVFTFGADLLGAAGRLNGTLFRVSHKAAMDVSERGAKAGAASALLSGPRPLNATWAPHARSNRPFLVLVWEVATQSLLLLGKVATPAAG